MSILSFSRSVARPCLTCRRSFFLSSLFSTESAQQSQLAQLRRKTGFAFALCRKALDMHEQDIEKAEKWMRAEALKHGWEKAQAIKNRRTAEGLIGIFTEPDFSRAAILEVNCETDFVSRTDAFHQLVSQLTHKLSQLGSASLMQNQHNQHSDIGNLSRISFGAEHLEKEVDQQSVVMAINKLGENIRLSRGMIMVNNRRDEGVKLVGYTHAVGGKIVPNDFGVLVGKYGTIIALKSVADGQSENEKEIERHLQTTGKQLAQHIIGMNPLSVDRVEGKVDDDEPTSLLHQEFIFRTESAEEEEQIELEETKATPYGRSDSPITSDSPENATTEGAHEEEKVEEVHDSEKPRSKNVTVGRFLKDSQVQVVDFIRLECGVFE